MKFEDNIYIRQSFHLYYMSEYKKLNNLFGWVCFLVATSVYALTMERTGSWWDCGEFISCAYKQQVPHQPGAPLYILIYKLFTLLAGSNRLNIAFWGNFASACCSGATILFLFWTITAFARKLLLKTEAELTRNSLYLIIGAGIVGALAYTFSDTFWFSAVEAEVYSLASLTVAITFWAVLKWDAIADEPGADRWLVFIAFMVGYSVGVHLLNLLTIPAVIFVIYFRRFDKNSTLGFLIALVVSIAILGFVQLGVVPGTVQLMAFTDRIFVNSLGFSMGSGVIFFAIVLFTFLGGGIWYTIHTNRVGWNTAFLCLTFMYIGLSVFIQVPIRAHANAPLNNQHPDDPYNFNEYLTRAQYGDGAPLLKGPMFNSQPTGNLDQGPNYRWNGKNYVVIGEKMKDTYNPDETVLFPRIWDNDNRQQHVDFYRNWLNIPKDSKPSWVHDNLGFFVSYQVYWMFGRYFMWNFAGRQNDVEGEGNNRDGNWISGIKPLDNSRLGIQPAIPAEASPNLAHSTLFLFPLILGILGLAGQAKKDTKNFGVLLIFFLFTGLAIIVFLNQTGPEPRERDYSFGGAFYTFSVWIGLGVIAVAEFLKRFTKPLTAIGISFAICLLAVPVVMASQEWAGHDRSQRRTVRDFATDYLNSCAPNAILFTYGDNDTYPLWYVQEVEGVRPDIRIVNLSLLGIDWYIKQMHGTMNDSPALPFSLSSDAYFGNNRNIVPFKDGQLTGNIELKDVMQLIGSEDPAAKVTFGDQAYNFFPTKNLKISIDPKQVISSGTMLSADQDKIVKEIDWTLPATNLYKNDVAELDIISTNNWKRPLYFAKTLPPSALLGLKDYMHLEGLAYRLLPIKAIKGTDEMSQIAEQVNLVPMYDNFMNKFHFGNINKNIFLDPEARGMVPVLKQVGWDLAYKLYNQHKIDSATKVLDHLMAETPSRMPELDDRFTINQLQFNILISALYYDLKQPVKAHKLLNYSADYTINYLKYFKEKETAGQDESVQGLLYMLQQMNHIATEKNDLPLAKTLDASYKNLAPKFGFGANGQ